MYRCKSKSGWYTEKMQMANVMAHHNESSSSSEFNSGLILVICKAIFGKATHWTLHLAHHQSLPILISLDVESLPEDSFCPSLTIQLMIQMQIIRAKTVSSAEDFHLILSDWIGFGWWKSNDGFPEPIEIYSNHSRCGVRFIVIWMRKCIFDEPTCVLLC